MPDARRSLTCRVLVTQNDGGEWEAWFEGTPLDLFGSDSAHDALERLFAGSEFGEAKPETLALEPDSTIDTLVFAVDVLVSG